MFIISKKVYYHNNYRTLSTFLINNVLRFKLEIKYDNIYKVSVYGLLVVFTITISHFNYGYRLSRLSYDLYLIRYFLLFFFVALVLQIVA